MKRLLPIRSEICARAGSTGHGSRGGVSRLSDLKVDILAENQDYLVVNKPCDLRLDGDFDVTLEKFVLGRVKGLDKVRWVHQLDFATSGCICMGLNRRGAGNASKMFAGRKTRKYYLALVYGHLDRGLFAGKGVDDYKYSTNTQAVRVEDKFENSDCFYTSEGGVVRDLLSDFGSSIPVLEVSGAISAIPDDFRMRIDPSEGREAKTQVVVLEHGSLYGVDVTKVLLRPIQGRRHQLRLHCLHLGYPILGDATYGPVFESCVGAGDGKFYNSPERMFLHALRLEIPFKSDAVKRIKPGSNGEPPGDMCFETRDIFELKVNKKLKSIVK